MSYTRVWSEIVPASSDSANQLATFIDNSKTDIRERIADIFGIVDFTVDPLIPTVIKLNRTTHAKILGGTTDLSLRNSADSVDNILITDGGLITLRNTLTVSSGGIVVTGNSSISGNLTSTFIGNITGNVTGNSDTATKLATPRTINGVSFDGSGNITITANTPNILTFGTHLTGTSFNGSAPITIATDATFSNVNSTIVSRDSSGDFSAHIITASLSGNASSATVLQTARTINGVSFNGSINITIAVAGSDLTGTSLAAGIISSSLTSLGTLLNLTSGGTVNFSSATKVLIPSTGASISYPDDGKIVIDSANGRLVYCVNSLRYYLAGTSY